MSLRSDERARRAFRDAVALRDNGEYDEALKALRPVLAAYPGSPAVLGTFGGILYAARRFAEAKEYFVQVLTVRPNAELASLALFHCHWALGEHDEARAELVRYLSGNDSDEYAQLMDEMGWEFDRVHHRLLV